jgi:putative ABC transport system permease protein
VLEGIAVFTWVVGLGTIVAGVVGVGNILLISVAERRREIGIRRAIGASAGSIVAMVLREALILTVVSGYGGLLLGIAVITWLAPLLPPNDVFRDPTAEPVALAIANVVLVVAGLVAGAIPAYRATRLTPVEALRG